MLSANTKASVSLSGSGTKDDPYLIQSAADLLYFQKQVAKGSEAATVYKSKYVKLMTSVDLNGAEFIIGVKGTRVFFDGTFDGNNCSIYNLNITEASDYAGLFAGVSITGTIKDLSVYGNVVGSRYTGGIAGQCQGTISNCTNYATVIQQSENGCGGITGGLQGSVAKLIGCVNYGSIICENTESQKIAGIVGAHANANFVVENCINFGTVKGYIKVGGISGEAGYNTITSCKNYGEISGYQRVAGIVGHCVSNIDNSANYGVVTGTNYVGGIVGTLSTCVISNTHNSGDVSATKYAGGILGCEVTNGNGTIRNCSNSGVIVGNTVGGILGGTINTSNSFVLVENCINTGSPNSMSGVPSPTIIITQ